MSAGNQPSNRSACPISFALGIFGDRWTLLVLRDLILRDKHRFRDFLDAPEGIATNVLTDRLTRLVDAGLVTREQDPDDRRQWIYRPTRKAIELVPTLVELVVWGGRNDPESGVPPEFLARYDCDRAELIRSIQAKAGDS